MLVFGNRIVCAQTISLDTAINSAVEELSFSLKKDSKIAILSLRSDSARMSNYLIEELTSAIVNQRLFTVVDRAQLDLIRQEMNFQMSGEVSDSSAQAIGQKLGAQAIVTGTFESLGDYYRFRVRVIEVESAAILVTYSVNVQNDRVVTFLMGNSGGTPAAQTASNYQNFTSGQRWGTWALNFVPGLGSFVIMHDRKGGITQAVLGGLGLILGSVGGPLIADSFGIGWMIMAGTGGALLASQWIFNIVRSASYGKPRRTASLVDPAAWNIAILPGKNGIEKVHLAYTLRF